LSQPFGKGQACGDFSMERCELEMGVEVDQARRKGDPWKFQNFLPGAGHQIRASFLNGLAGDTKSTRAKDTVRRRKKGVGQNEHDFSGRFRRPWIWRGDRPKRVSATGEIPIPFGQ
jgi:hypothetical protein